MTRLVLTILATILVVAFAMVNTQHVELSFVFGAPVQVRLVFLLASSFVAGMVCVVFLQLLGTVRARARAKRERRDAT